MLIIKISFVFQGLQRLKLIRAVFQIKTVPSGRIMESSILWSSCAPGKNIYTVPLEQEVEVVAYFCLGYILDSLMVCWMRVVAFEPLISLPQDGQLAENDFIISPQCGHL